MQIIGDALSERASTDSQSALKGIVVDSGVRVPLLACCPPQARGFRLAFALSPSIQPQAADYRQQFREFSRYIAIYG